MNASQRKQMTSRYVSTKVLHGADLSSITGGVIDPVEQSKTVTAAASDGNNSNSDEKEQLWGVAIFFVLAVVLCLSTLIAIL